jgi:hypothetical protein
MTNGATRLQHTVRDYPVWRAIYDSLDEVQRDWGVTAASVHRLADAPRRCWCCANSSRWPRRRAS